MNPGNVAYITCASPHIHTCTAHAYARPQLYKLNYTYLNLFICLNWYFDSLSIYLCREESERERAMKRKSELERRKKEGESGA